MRELTVRDLRALLALANAATPGPWRSFIEGRDHTAGSHFIQTGLAAQRGNDIELSGASEADHDFIAAARDAGPKLIVDLARCKGWRL